MEKLSGSEPFNHGCLDFEGRIWLAISFSFEAPLSIQTALGVAAGDLASARCSLAGLWDPSK